jgi:acyl-CoA thioesterase-1
MKALTFLLLLTLPLQGQETKPAAKKADPIAAMAQPQVVDAALPNVLLIGDSISIGYTAAVRKALEGKANVFRPPTNCGPTSNGLKNIDSWLGDTKWTIIHFNWGLHDLKYVGEKGSVIVDPDSAGARQQIPANEYEKNLRALTLRLQKTGARLIWCATTPVPTGAKGRIPGDEKKYNEIAAAIMKELKVETNDLHTAATANLAKIQKKSDVHFTDDGSVELAKTVAESIRKALPHKK